MLVGHSKVCLSRSNLGTADNGFQILKEPVPFLAFRLKYSKNLNRKNRIWVQCSGLFLIWSLVPFISWTRRNSSPLAEDPKTLNKVFGPGIGPLM